MANHRKLWDAKLRGLKRKSGQPGYQISLFKFLKNYISGEPIEKCLRRANILAGYVVGFETAIPPYSEELKEQII